MARAVSRDIVILGPRRKTRLEAIARRPSAAQALVRRVRIVLLAHAGWPNARIAAELGCAVNTVREWRSRFVRGGIPALRDRPRSGRPETYGPEVRLAIVAIATSVPPEGTSAWECVRFFVRGDFCLSGSGCLSGVFSSRYLMCCCPFYPAASPIRAFHAVPGLMLRVPVIVPSCSFRMPLSCPFRVTRRRSPSVT